MQCTAIAQYSGKRCRMFALRGEDKCVIHSDSERAKHERSKIKLLTRKGMIVKLQRQLYKVEQNKTLDPLERSKEMRMLVTQINDLISEETGGKQSSDGMVSFEKRVEAAKRETSGEEK